MSPIAFLLFALPAVPQQAPAVVQQISTGWCSPNISNVTGTVTVNCKGVDPRAVARLNAELAQKKLEFTQAVELANQWARRYHQLEKKLQDELGNEDQLSKQAREYLHQGNLDKVIEILEALRNTRDKQAVDRAAERDYEIALAYRLKFDPLKALPLLEEACRYRPKNLEYAQEYARVLLQENDFQAAERALLSALDLAPSQDEAARLLSDLASIYNTTGRMKEAEENLQRAISTYFQLLRVDPNYPVDELLFALGNLAKLYSDTGRYDKAEQCLLQAHSQWQVLAQNKSPSYAPFVVGTRIDLGIVYLKAGQMQESEAALKSTAEISRNLAKTSEAIYQPLLAAALNNLGKLYTITGRLAEAERALQEAVEAKEGLAKSNPATYQPSWATALNNLADVYRREQKFSEAEKAFLAAVAIQRNLVSQNAAAYEPALAPTLATLAAVHAALGKSREAQLESEEAVQILRRLWAANPAVYGDLLANSLLLAALFSSPQNASRACDLTLEATKVAIDAKTKQVARDSARNCDWTKTSLPIQP